MYKKGQPAPSPIVITELLAKQDGESNQILNASQAIGLAAEVSQSKCVFIKPNLTYPVYKKGVTTRQGFVRNIVSVLKQINPQLKIYIGEGEGGYNSFSMTDAMRQMGYFELEKEFSHVHVVNLSRQPSQSVALKTKHGQYTLELPSLFFNEIDFSISCPLPKVHCMTGITLSYKNQWGCLPDMMRLKNHFVFNEIISQVCNILKFRYAFLDGKFGLDDNGPMVGTPVEVDWFVAANNLGAFDIVVSEMMGIDWKTIQHLKEAHKLGFVPERSEIEVIGDLESLKRPFKLRRTFWNYPALIAFKSSYLTHLVYFSRWAKLLHDIMYTFRKRPIDPLNSSSPS